MIQKYTTKNREDQLFEAHNKYIDIQAVIKGCETIGWAPADSIDIVEPYTYDIYKGTEPLVFTELVLNKGTFAIFYPGDAHKPSCDYREKGQIIKIVVKVKI
jgi:biofilm protein TabA